MLLIRDLCILILVELFCIIDGQTEDPDIGLNQSQPIEYSHEDCFNVALKLSCPGGLVIRVNASSIGWDPSGQCRPDREMYKSVSETELTELQNKCDRNYECSFVNMRDKFNCLSGGSVCRCLVNKVNYTCEQPGGPVYALTEAKEPYRLPYMQIEDKRYGVCYHKRLGDKEATVFCKSILGKGYVAGQVYDHPAPAKDKFPENKLSGVKCDGKMKTNGGVYNCSHDGIKNETCPEMKPIACMSKGSATLQFGTFGNIGLLDDLGRTAFLCAPDMNQDHLNDNVARVACIEKGFKQGHRVAAKTFGRLKSHELNNAVSCTGNEKKLKDCRETLNDSLWTSEYAAICSDIPLSPNDIDVTLSEGFYGRVTVTHYGKPGLICGKDDSVWSNISAEVICQQLGHDTGQPFCCGALGTPDKVGGLPVFMGNGGQRLPIWLQNVTCHGNESRFEKCDLGQWGGHGDQCDVSDNVGVVCYNFTGENETEYGIKLFVKGSMEISNYGQVQVLHKGVLGSIAMEHFTWTEREASAVCRDKGYQYGLPHHGQPWGLKITDRPVWLYNVSCEENVTTLLNCTHAGWGAATWNHKNDVGVVCYNDDTENVGKAIIRRMIYENYGRAEIQYKKVWGTICNHNWTDLSADVFCRQAGFQYGGLATNALRVHQIPRWITEVNCTGDESNIENCTYRGWGGLDECPPEDEAGVICFSNSVNKEADYELHLTDGSWDRGLVRLALDERRGHLCSVEPTWTNAHANIVCSKLGFKGGSTIFSSGKKSDNEPYWMKVSSCPNNTTNFIDCKERNIGFGKANGCKQRAFVWCRNHSVVTTAGNSHVLEGPVGVFNDRPCTQLNWQWNISVQYPWIIEFFYRCQSQQIGFPFEKTEERKKVGVWCSRISINHTLTLGVIGSKGPQDDCQEEEEVVTYRRGCENTEIMKRRIEWEHVGNTTNVSGNDVMRRRNMSIEMCQDNHMTNNNVIQLYYDDLNSTCYAQMYGFYGPHINITGYMLNTYQRICVVDGEWSAWSDWSQCTCDTLNQTRRRTCSDPAPYKGKQCDGDSYQVKDCLICSTGIDETTLTSTSADEETSSTPTPDADTTYIYRSTSPERDTAQSPTPASKTIPVSSDQESTELDAETSTVISTTDVDTDATSTPPTWKPWGPWESCSDPCDGAIITRSRNCSVPGKCFGLSTNISTCYMQECENKRFYDDEPEFGEDAEGAVVIGSFEIALVLLVILGVMIYDMPAIWRDLNILARNLRDTKENVKDWLKINPQRPSVTKPDAEVEELADGSA